MGHYDDKIEEVFQRDTEPRRINGFPTPPPAPVAAPVAPEEETTKVTGGSSPSYYRKSLNLPLSGIRLHYVNADLEAGDVIDAWDLNFNMGNILKSTLRGDNKDGVDDKYALDKIIWFSLREQLKKGIISHEEFWQKAKAVGLSKEL